MLRKGVTSVKLAMEKLEHFLELGGTKKDITLLVISGIALIVSIFDLVLDASWAAIFLCGIPIILEAVIGLVTAFDIKADVLVSLALIASVCIGEDFAAGEVAFIMQFGGLLEELTVARARAGIDKLAHIRAYQAAGDKVCTIGDGVNDSPALSEADAGIAISTGAAIAREIADITISSEDLFALVTLRSLSQELMARIHRNYRFIVSFNFSLIVLGVLGILPPTTSALLHNMSTLAIGLKSMTNLLPESEQNSAN